MRPLMRLWIAAVLCCLTVADHAAAQAARPAAPPSTLPAQLEPTADNYRNLADEAEWHLNEHVLKVWFPRSIDKEAGGYRAGFSRSWRPRSEQGKFSVFNARMAWITAQVAMRRPDRREEFLGYARHGQKFLAEHLWDAEHGGFWWGLGNNLQPSELFGDAKHLYGVAFAIYGAASVAEATGDPKDLELVQKAFDWIEEQMRDRKNGGYFESVTRRGTPISEDPDYTMNWWINFSDNRKSMNSYIHLLEAYTQVYRVWKDDRVKQALHDQLWLILDKMYTEPGTLHQYLNADLTPIATGPSYGHDIEAGYLIAEAAEQLGQLDDSKVQRAVRALIDNPLKECCDPKTGRFCESSWWAQAEAFNALLMAHEMFGSAQDPRYFDAFLKSWAYFRDHFIDERFGGIHASVSFTGRGSGSKSQNWKAAYHDGRALLNVAERLRRLADAAETGTK